MQAAKTQENPLELPGRPNLYSRWELISRIMRNLTLYGRITILKSLAISKLVYNTSVLTFPSKFTAMVNQAIAQFVWNKKAKIKHRTMIGPKEQGGLDMPDFQIINDACLGKKIK